MNRINDFIKFLLCYYQNDLEEIIEENGGDSLCLKSGKSMDEIIYEIYDSVSDYIETIENSNLTKDTIKHENGDGWVFIDGIWYTELYENHGWYFWIEPEGERFGLYSSYEEALNDSINL